MAKECQLIHFKTPIICLRRVHLPRPSNFNQKVCSTPLSFHPQWGNPSRKTTGKKKVFQTFILAQATQSSQHKLNKLTCRCLEWRHLIKAYIFHLSSSFQDSWFWWPFFWSFIVLNMTGFSPQDFKQNETIKWHLERRGAYLADKHTGLAFSKMRTRAFPALWGSWRAPRGHLLRKASAAPAAQARGASPAPQPRGPSQLGWSLPGPALAACSPPCKFQEAVISRSHCACNCLRAGEWVSKKPAAGETEKITSD